MNIEVKEGCPFEHSEFPRCKVVSKDKRKFCLQSFKCIGVSSFAKPPKWCPLRKEPIVVKLVEEKGGESNGK